MSFTGTQEKCKACDKTVYVMDQLSADGVSFHKSCFKCSHCKGTLKLSNYSSMEGVLYCKPHFEQLFKESGNLTKNFQASVAKSAEKLTPELTRSPSKAAGMFSGTQEKCATCGKTAYPLEKGFHHFHPRLEVKSFLPLKHYSHLQVRRRKKENFSKALE
ncbi:LIM domain-containing protein WLIM2b [Ranunculus cassubicifolius]